jgi:DNA-binding NarL/FixJ family response regulator
MNQEPLHDRRRRILVVDDHPIVRRGIAGLLDAQSDLCCAGEADSVPAAQRLLRDGKFDLLLVDVSLPGVSGLDLVRRVRSSDQFVPILVLSMHEETMYAERALTAGAQGYVMKHESSDLLLAAIRKLLAGGIFVSPAIEKQMLHGFAGNKPAHTSAAGFATLNDREFEVLQLIAQGLTSNEIAGRICRSLKSVEAYRTAIRAKLGARTTIDLARIALEVSGSGSREI